MDAWHFWRTFGGDDYHWVGGTVDSWNRRRDCADVRLAPDPDDPSDVDIDGLADAWEIDTFGSTYTDGTSDVDGDGMSEFEEYQAGTDPGAAASLFRVSTLSREGPLLRVKWPSAVGSL